ncbi:hypothetical protein BDZ85DRAFT_299830 [Elsinoe ampelina]|uniref:Rhodopsin domain-containing protein n=1 Tax=Elsinoe ampelina TaxID=302913 RepID=A0A6A6GN84_9PEZI|nr:hypothetical protein BDZ85DRAFT_299830 [Elsinoe ampelina]
MAVSITDILEALHHLSAISKAFLVITTIALCLRIWTRAFILRRVGLDDYAMVMAYLCYVATCALTLVVSFQVHNIFRGHPMNMKALPKIVKADTSLYIFTMVFLKISLGFFFRDIFKAHRAQRMLVWFIMITSTLWGIANCLFSVFSCGLLRGFLVNAPDCAVWHQYGKFSIAWSSYNAATDMILAIIAVHALWIANLHTRAQIYASIVLIFGTVGGVASIVRIAVITEASQGLQAYTIGLKSGYWTLLEAGIGITAANLACLRPLLRACRDKITSSFSRTAPTEMVDTIPFTENTFSSHGFSKNLTGLSSALTAQGPQTPQIRDWREDRIDKDLEYCTPSAAIIGSVTTNEQAPGRQWSLQTHNLI